MPKNRVFGIGRYDIPLQFFKISLSSSLSNSLSRITLNGNKNLGWATYHFTKSNPPSHHTKSKLAAIPRDSCLFSAQMILPSHSPWRPSGVWFCASRRRAERATLTGDMIPPMWWVVLVFDDTQVFLDLSYCRIMALYLKSFERNERKRLALRVSLLLRVVRLCVENNKTVTCDFFLPSLSIFL